MPSPVGEINLKACELIVLTDDLTMSETVEALSAM